MVDWKICIREAAGAAGHVLDEDIVEELEGHAQSAFQAARAEGCNVEEAEQSVLSLVDGWIREAAGLQRRPQSKPLIERTRASRSRVAGLANDFRFALRIF